MAMGTNTDPYQPVEREIGLTRAILEVLREFRHPVSIVTKSTLILRDVDILADMASRGMASVCISVTTLDRRLARLMEPRAPTPQRRLEAIKALNEAGVPTGALVAPIIPALNDMEIDRIVAAIAEAGGGIRRLCAASLAARDQGSVRGMAGGALSRPEAACAVADSPDPRRRGLPLGMVARA